MTQNKQWKDFSEQLAILKSRGLLVDDESKALHYLERIGYYRLSGYWYPFRELDMKLTPNSNATYLRKDQFLANSYFKDAVNLYVFDKKLRLLALDALERIELAVRVDISYILGKQDIHAHENPSLFSGHFSKKLIKHGYDLGKTEHQVWLVRYKQVLHRARKEPFVDHYLKKYGKLPLWVAIEVWDFGIMSKLYSGMGYKDQIVIAKKYGASNGKAFAGWLRSFNFIRNVAAHHSRLWNINILERANLLQDDSYWQSLNNSRPFYYFCLMQKLLRIICPNSNWGDRFINQLNAFPMTSNNAVSLTDFGVMKNWQNWELWKGERADAYTFL